MRPQPQTASPPRQPASAHRGRFARSLCLQSYRALTPPEVPTLSSGSQPGVPRG